MTSNRDRQRAAARARLEREMTERAERTRHRRRRTQTVLAAGAAVLVVVGGVTWLILANRGGKKAAAPSTSASPSSAYEAKCVWSPLADPSASPKPPVPAEIKDVGTPPAEEARSGTQVMTITTNLGVLKIEVDTAHAPCAAENFTFLAGKQYYDNTKCHRMTTSGIYVLQCGDPSATGRGGTTYRYGEENLPTGRRPAYPEGTVAMANTGQPASTGTQFFIVYKDTQLDANYTVLGKVTEGLDIIKKVAEAGVTPGEGGSENDGAPKTEVKIQTLRMSAPAPAPSSS